MNSKDKPYKGEITNISKLGLESIKDVNERKSIKRGLDERYGPNLGYIFRCDFLNHPVFRGLSAFGGNTSLVVKYDEATGEVETLNSRYKVVK